MVSLLLESQAAAFFTTIVTMLISAVLAYFMTSKFLNGKAQSAAFWSVGLWLFTFSVFEEVLFAIGIYSAILIKIYLAIVAILVQFLAMGSLAISSSKKTQKIYYGYSAVMVIFIGIALAVSDIGNIISSYVVFGALPMLVILSSSLITFPAAVILLVVAAISYKRTRSPRMLSIIVGVIVVSIAGTLYIVQFPSFLYIAELIGIVLLWLGFFDWKASVREGTPSE